VSETIVIELDTDAAMRAHAEVFSAEGRWLKSVNQACLAQDAQDEQAIIVLKGSAVAVYAMQLPAFADNKLLKILPGLFEDKLAQTAGERHFALFGDHDDDRGTRTVAVVDMAVMHKIRDFTLSHAIVPLAIVPDFMLLPVPEAPSDEAVRAVEFDGRVCTRFSDGGGFTAEPDQAALMLPAYAEVGPLNIEDWRQLLAVAPQINANLLQGDFSRRGNMAAGLVWFRRAALLAAAALIILTGSKFYEARDNHRHADALYVQAEQVFRTALPGEMRIVNMETQMRRAVQAHRQQGGDEFFILSDIAFQAIAANKNALLETLRYDQSDRKLALDVSFSSFSDSEGFKQQLRQSGAQITEGSSRQEDTRVFAEFTIARK